MYTLGPPSTSRPLPPALISVALTQAIQSICAVSNFRLDAKATPHTRVHRNVAMDHRLHTEMSNVSKFLLSRQKLGLAGEDGGALAKRLADAMVSQVHGLPSMDAEAAARLNDALDASAYSDAGKALIASAIENKLTAADQVKRLRSPTSTFSPTQYLHSGWPNYLTAGEWDTLRSSQRSVDLKIQVLADRMVAIGLRNPDEWTFAWALSLVIVSHFETLPMYKQISAMLGDLKTSFRSSSAVWPLEVITKYPESPAGLPWDVYQHVYADEKPVEERVPRLRTVAKSHIPLRRNSRLLVEERRRVEKGRKCKRLVLCSDSDDGVAGDTAAKRTRRNDSPAVKSCKLPGSDAQPRGDVACPEENRIHPQL